MAAVVSEADELGRTTFNAVFMAELEQLTTIGTGQGGPWLDVTDEE